MAVHGYNLTRGQDVRFQDLSVEEQNAVIQALDQGIAPEVDDPRITADVVRRWYADLALLKFWVNLQRKMKDKK